MSTKNIWNQRGRAAVALVLCAVLLLSPFGGVGVKAVSTYMDPYLDRMVEYGFLQGDTGGLRPYSEITRAEFVTIVNRAFGYSRQGGHPFTDVPETAWYAQDVDIAYTEGYISGTSANTFSPYASLTREEAVTIIGRNLMLEPAVGEDITFTDSRNLSVWSRGLVSTAVQYGVVSGYPDGSFRPQQAVTRGEAAIMLLNAVGTPVQTPGVQSLGSVWGNVTITSPGVTLRDTVIAGNLYVTAGVGLGDILLENVTVLGEIVVSGGGLSERGDDSVVLRNVTSPRLVVDNLQNQRVSVRVEGDGLIDRAAIRTDAFLADNTDDGRGISLVELDGENETTLELAGNVKEVINRTPESTLSVGSGRVGTLTVDEAAVDSVLHIASGAEVDTVNLDVGTTVTGDGDIGTLIVNANGSTVSMLPDEIVIRPGSSATIDGTTMDSAAAAESSADPRLLSGYPQITDLAPTTATAAFSGNKSGTVYWAVSSVTDGSVPADDLIQPPSYATNIVRSGNLTLSGAGQSATARLTGLVTDGSYYLSAVLVDARGDQSPLKVISFTTPDNTVPDFADGYPYMSRVTNVSGQVTVMATKTCRLYYALLPAGAAAPTEQDFRSNAVTGNLGFGVLDVEQNTAYSFDVNDVALEELAEYELYLWLTDVDGGESSRIESLSFTTVDGTPPQFNTEPTVNRVEDSSVGLYANLNEDGTLYWVLVAQGEEYPKPLANQPGPVDWASDTAKLQVANGMNALDSGSVSMRENQDVSFNVSGLDAETAYDLYYVAQDEAGNYSASIGRITIHSLDANAPTVTQEFDRYNGTDTTTPLPDTNIRLVFSETVENVGTNTALTDYYQDVLDVQGTGQEAAAREQMRSILSSSIKLYVDTGSGRPVEVEEAVEGTDKINGSWTIDWRRAEITQEEGRTVITLRTTDDLETSALHLASGAEYYFEIQANTIADTSDAQNVMGTTALDTFTTVFAIVNLSNPNESDLTYGGENVIVDVSWLLDPATTESVADNVDWDMLIWTDVSVRFDLYRRTQSDSSVGAWEKVNTTPVEILVPDGVSRYGISLTRIQQTGNTMQFQPLNQLLEDYQYEYAIHFTEVGGLGERDTWSSQVTIGVTLVAGNTSDLSNLAVQVSDDGLQAALDEGVTDIGQPRDFTLRRQFSDRTAPQFVDNRPQMTAGDDSVHIYLMLDRPGTIYYVVAPLGTVTTVGTDSNGQSYNFSAIREDGDLTDYNRLPTAGSNDPTTGDMEYEFTFSSPTVQSILNAGNNANTRIKHGSIRGSATEVELVVEDLEVLQEYIAYFVIQGTSSQAFSQVYAYRFSTEDVEPAYLTMQALNPEVQFTTSQDANVTYVLYAANRLPDRLNPTGASGNMLGNHLSDDYTGENAPTGDLKNQLDSMPLLTALLTTIDGSTGESWFDRYASDDIKEEIRQIITSQSTSDALDKGTLDGLVQGQPEAHDFTAAMNPDSATTYICLATAQNVLGGEWTFKAVDGVRIPDETPPVLVSVTTVPDKVDTGGSIPRVSGIVTLRFSENIYHLPENGDTSALRMITTTTTPSSSTTQVSFLSLVTQANTNLEYSGTGISTGTNTVVLRFWDAPVGANFSFCNTGYLADAWANSRRDDGYTLTLTATEGGIGLIGQGQSYEFVVTHGQLG